MKKWRILPHDPEQSWLRYVWLVYALPFAASAFLPGIPAVSRLVIGAGFVAFLSLFVAGHWLRGPRLLAVVGALALLAIFYSRMTEFAAVFFVYGAAFLGSFFTRRQAMLAIGIQLVVALAAGLLLDFGLWYYVPALAITTLIGAVTIHGHEQSISNAKLRLAGDEITRLAQVAERERIARDLHDLLGHTLSVIALKAELARKVAVSDPPRAAQEISEVETIAREGLAQVRSAITGYRSSGLAAEIETACQTLRVASINAEVQVQSVPLGPAEETAIALALREATTNVIRHASAKHCRIRLSVHDGSALLEIEDDGRGTDKPFGNGLSGMRERLVALGGALTREWAHAAEPRGTRLLISMPLKHNIVVQ